MLRGRAVVMKDVPIMLGKEEYVPDMVQSEQKQECR